MVRPVGILSVFAFAVILNVVSSAKQKVPLSDSYLPVAMQVIAHLADQMAYEARDEPVKATSSPTSRPTARPTNRPGSRPTSRPMSSIGSKPTGRPDSVQQTTPYHRPGLYAPIAPPKPEDRIYLLPPNQHPLHTVIRPLKHQAGEHLLSYEEEQVKPLMEPALQSHLLPPNFEAEVDKVSRSDSLLIDDLEENLQYLSPNLREMIEKSIDPDDEQLVDIEELRAGPEMVKGGKLSSSNLRLLLLYDLLSRDAKKQKLSDYFGFSPDVLQTLSESSSGGARAQLSLALSKMIERKDCTHDYANNRAREMVDELAKDESKLSSEIRYLQPLIYNRI